MFFYHDISKCSHLFDIYQNLGDTIATCATRATIRIRHEFDDAFRGTHKGQSHLHRHFVEALLGNRYPDVARRSGGTGTTATTETIQTPLERVSPNSDL